MRQKDIALIVVITAISVVISIFVSKAIFTPPKNRQQKVDVVQPITPDFPSTNKQYFNSNSIDPTQLVTPSQNANPNPFNSSSQ